MIKPCGYYLVVKPDPVEDTINGIVVSLESSKEKEKRAQVLGTIVSIGPDAWKDYGNEPWAEVGDRVAFSKYGGKFLTDPANGEELVVLNDNDVVAVLTEE